MPSLYEKGGGRPGNGQRSVIALSGESREKARAVIIKNHYARSVSSGKSHYFSIDAAIVIFSIPANKNVANFLLGYPGCVWELSRLWAPDGHEPNLLTRAISAATKGLLKIEAGIDALVSYADPNVGHSGFVYRASSWLYCGQCEEGRYYVDGSGQVVARRAFHSGRKSLTKAEIIALGYEQLSLPGKHRFVRPISRGAKKSPRLLSLAEAAARKHDREIKAASSAMLEFLESA